MAYLVVLAGGRSTRFGRDKCTYELGGKRLIDRVIEAGRELFDNIFIAAGANAHLYTGYNVIEDSHRFTGPLAAVDTAAHMLQGDIVFAPCDVPYVTGAVFEELLRQGGVFAVWVYPNGRVESSIFKMSAEGGAQILDILASYGRSRIDDLFRVGKTTFLSMLSHGANPSWFKNVNRPQDLEREIKIDLRIFLKDVELSWSSPPLVKWLKEGDVEALKVELLRYLELGLFSMAAHVAKDLGRSFPPYNALGEILYGAIDIEKA